MCREWRSCVLETQELWKTLDLTVEAQTEWEQRLARKHEIQKWKNVLGLRQEPDAISCNQSEGPHILPPVQSRQLVVRIVAAVGSGDGQFAVLAYTIFCV